MKMFWKSHNLIFNAVLASGEDVKVYMSYEIKLNLACLIHSKNKVPIYLVNCAKDSISSLIIKEWLDNTEFSNSSDKLSCVSKYISTSWKHNWCPKGIKVKNIQVEYLIY